MIPTAGLQRIAELIKDDASHIAVGTGTTDPASGDTTLETETNRAVVSNATRMGAVAEARAFFTNSNLPSTVEEIGLFLNGSSTPDSGSLGVRRLNEFVKASSDLLVLVQVTVSEASS